MLKRFLKHKWMWLIYIMMFIMLTAQRTRDFFSPHEPDFFYYRVVMIFAINQNLWPLTYLGTLASLILNTVTIMILWFYIREKYIFSIPFVFAITSARLVSDLFGYSYQWNTAKSLFYFSSPAAYLAVITIIFWIVPSYLAMADYINRKVKTSRPRA